jgi:hypothetical protein
MGAWWLGLDKLCQALREGATSVGWLLVIVQAAWYLQLGKPIW